MSDFKKLCYLVSRNIKLYFKDKLTFFLSMLTPIILIILFLAFLKNVYESSLTSALPPDVVLNPNILNAFSGSCLFASIIAVSCITVAFCSNLMIEDKIKGVTKDFLICPINKSLLQTSYVIANFITTFLVCFIILIISLIYLSIVGWFLTFLDILLILVDMILSIALGTLLISTISMFISSQGGLSAVCTLVSSMYGFICGAYMPIASMGSGIQAFTSLIPGTYGTVLFKQFYLNGVLAEMEKTLPTEAVDQIAKSFDVKFSFFGTEVSTPTMFIILIVSCIVLFGLFILISMLKGKKHIDKSQKNNKQIKEATT